MYRLISWRYGYKEYLSQDKTFYSSNRKNAGIFTGNEKDKYPHLWPEEVSEAEKMEMAGSPKLPGFGD